jgi:hypothetical protein
LRSVSTAKLSELIAAGYVARQEYAELDQPKGELPADPVSPMQDAKPKKKPAKKKKRRGARTK